MAFEEKAEKQVVLLAVGSQTAKRTLLQQRLVAGKSLRNRRVKRQMWKAWRNIGLQGMRFINRGVPPVYQAGEERGCIVEGNHQTTAIPHAGYA